MTEPKQHSSPARQILEVFYAPQKAFREIIQEPKYLGTVIILILFIASNVGFGYTLWSRSYIEQTLPKAGQLDEWTENATLWTSMSGANVTENFDDFINGTYYGNRSIEFSMLNSSQIFMELMNIGPINCSGPDGYQNVSVRIKLVEPGTSPAEASIYLYSQTPSNYSCYNLTDVLSSSVSSVWNDLTIPLATENWTLNNNPDWGNINGLKLELGWRGNVNITVLVDGLFFRGIFKSPLETSAAVYLLNYGIDGLMQFAIRWIFISGLIFIMVKALGSKTLWKPILICVGYALVIIVVQSVINTIAISTLPRLYYPLEYIGGTQSEMDIATTKILDKTSLVSAIIGYVQILTMVWIIILCTIATRLLTEFSWVKSALVSVAAVLVSVLLGMLLGI